MEQVKTIPYFAHENAMFREERKEKRLWIMLLAMIGVNGVLICLGYVLRRNKAN